MKRSMEIISIGGIAMFFLCIALASAPSMKVVNTKYNGVFNMTDQKDDAVTNSAKLQSVRQIANPSIVLRVPNASREVTQEDNNIKVQKGYDGANYLNDINVYNVIEKELLKGGFTVRDRALFEKVLGDKNVSDYSKIKELTETDLILELSSLEFVKYPTNSFNYYTSSRRKGTISNTVQCSNYFDLYGLKLEFRLIQVKDNDFIGSFTYYYNPCANNACNYSINVGANNACSAPFIEQGNGIVAGPNLISHGEIEDFVEKSTSKMVHEILQNH